MSKEFIKQFSGDQPPSDGPQNKFDGTSNPDQGEQSALAFPVPGNRFPREKGHVSLTSEEVLLS